MAKRRRSGTIEVMVDVEVCNVIDEISDDDLLEEVSHRGLKVAPEVDPMIDDAFLNDLYEELRRGRTVEARVMLERFLFPKYRSLEASEQAFLAAKGKK
jgi:hypothetical protein